MISEKKFLEIFNRNNVSKLQKGSDLDYLRKKRAVKHYQKELEKMQEELLIESYQATGQHPCCINTGILVADLEEESGVKVTQNAINNFQEYLAAEILRAGDYD